MVNSPEPVIILRLVWGDAGGRFPSCDFFYGGDEFWGCVLSLCYLDSASPAAGTRLVADRIEALMCF
jgi:hypothetical protein